MEKFFKNLQIMKKEVERLGVAGEQILIEFVKNYQNLKDEKSEFGLSIIDVDIIISKNKIIFEAKSKNQKIEIIGATPKTFSSVDDDKEVGVTGYILVK